MMLRILLGVSLLVGGWAHRGYRNDEDFDIRPGLPYKCYEDPPTRTCQRGALVYFRWYYDKYSDSCKVFPNRGCLSKGNSFVTREECRHVCIRSTGPPPPPLSPYPWSARPDALDEMYGEPNGKHLHDGDIPFVNNLNNDELPPGENPQPRTPINGRSLARPDRNQGLNRQARPPFVRPMFRQHMAPPLQHQHIPRQQFQQPPQLELKKVEPKSGPKMKGDEFMSDSDIFDKPGEEKEKLVEQKEAPEVKEEKAEDTKAKPSVPDFMSDSDIFDGLPTIPKVADNLEEKQSKEKEIDAEDNAATKGAESEYNFADGDLDDGGLYTDSESTPQCLQFPETGSCRAYIRRWYFDPRKADCFTFIYGGCDGNHNSFATKDDCLRTCATQEKEKKPSEVPEPEEREEEEEEEDIKPEGKSRGYFGLRRKKPSNFETSPSNFETSPAQPFQAEPHEDIDEFDKKQENNFSNEDNLERQGEEETKEEDGPQIQQENRVPVINHFYTYHNYGPHHSKHRTFNTASYNSDSRSDSHDSSSSSEEKDDVLPDRVPDKGDHMIPAVPSPLNFFFRVLKKLKPRNSLAMMRPRMDGKPIIQSYHRKTNNGGISFVKFMFTKKQPKNQFDSFPGMRPGFSRNTLPERHLAFNHRNFPEPRQAMSPYHPRPQPQQPFMESAPSSFGLQPPLPKISSNPREQLLIDRFLNAPPKKTSFSMFPLMPFVMARQHKAPPPPVEPIKPQHGEPNLACSQPRDEGHCTPRIGMPRWFYDQDRGICDLFFYNGCGGTLNRFDTFEQCRAVCMVKSPAPPTDMVPRPPKPDEPLERKVEEKTEVKEEVAAEEKAKEEEKVEEEKEKVEEETAEEKQVVPQEVNSVPVMHQFEFAHMHMDSRMEFILVIVIMILGGTALIVLVAITAFYMYKKHKLATKGAKEALMEKVIHAHAYPEVHKISVIELPGAPGQPGVHALKSI